MRAVRWFGPLQGRGLVIAFVGSEAGRPFADRCKQGDAPDNDSERVQNA
jgi:hypothetical protein